MVPIDSQVSRSPVGQGLRHSYSNVFEKGGYLFDNFFLFGVCVDSEGGGGLDPLGYVRGGVLCGGLVGRRGGPKVVFFHIMIFFFCMARFPRKIF